MAQKRLLPNNIIECSICLDTIENDSEKLIKCYHKFHKECIERWKNSCNDKCIFMNVFIQNVLTAEQK